MCCFGDGTMCILYIWGHWVHFTKCELNGSGSTKMNFGISYGVRMVQKNGKILPLCSEFCAFLDGVIESIFWDVLNICVFLLWFCQNTGSGSWIKWVWSEFHFFQELDMLQFPSFCGFFSGFSALESRTEMMVQNFVPFCYWKSAKFVGNLQIHVLKHNARWTTL